MIAVIGILGLLVLPALIGIVRDKVIDHQLRRAQEAREAQEERGGRRGQKSSSRSTVPSTATWYADGRRSKKFVSS
jgi:type II secretory pathway pseudopilin PulG